MMDISTFYALFSATCFAMLGFWWQLLQGNPQWLRNPETRTAVGGVYLSFLFPALMGLFAQVGGTGTTTIWRFSFVAIAVIGLLATLRALPHSRRSDVDDTLNRLIAVVLYALIAVVGLVPEVGELVQPQGDPGRGDPADPAGAAGPRPGVAVHDHRSAGRPARGDESARGTGSNQP